MTLRRRPAALALSVALLAWPTFAPADPETLELKVKAAFLYNFAHLVSWPPQKFASAQQPLEVCIVEQDPIGPMLTDALAGKSVDAHPLEVRELASSANWRDCHVAYIDNRAPDEMRLLLHKLASSSVLTVHEAPTALADGVIRLYIEDRKLHFEINEAAAQRQGLRLSSRLMALASVVQRQVDDE